MTMVSYKAYVVNNVMLMMFKIEITRMSFLYSLHNEIIRIS